MSNDNKKSKSKAIKQSQTQDILRSQIHLNPYNPKRHTDEQVKQQVKNIKANGYLGGIVYNLTTGNLIDGHRRVQALDIINHYDGTTNTDYTIKVEVAEFDTKTEKEQMTFMALANTKADYNLVANYLDDIDLKNVGLSDEDMTALLSLYDTKDKIEDDKMSDFQSLYNSKDKIEDISTDFYAPRHTLDTEEKTFDTIAQERQDKEHESVESIKAKKKAYQQDVEKFIEEADSYIMLHFNSKDDMQVFSDTTGLPIRSNMIIDGIEFLDSIGM